MNFKNLLESKALKTYFYAYSLLIILLAVIPINSGNFMNDNYILEIRLDYLAHLMIFIPWVYLLSRVSSINFKEAPFKTLILILLGLIFATSTELIQYFLTYRAFNINDLIANGLGVVVGSVVFLK